MPDWFGILFGYAAYWIVILLEPFWLHYIGTTPGKWIFGIKLEIEYENCDFSLHGWLYATNEANIMTRKTDARMRLIFTIEQMN